eukprot:CAMPEP_0119420860 /NCGR_PEP_ID=MMETSP1335-20130426/24463_1 /TAXON_ID=259385 /ORGANISM="Chrysoculter rhomboideus, Strain RCC1486" /LENGTH=45 /DNA_ID= /DNA_START= /DNA_END= /DNA_ORIENTATION=
MHAAAAIDVEAREGSGGRARLVRSDQHSTALSTACTPHSMRACGC